MINEIVWLDNPLKYTYLREAQYCTCGYKLPLKRNVWNRQKAIVGYQHVEKDRRLRTFRVWWLKVHDRDFDPDGPYKNNWPCEAVVPTSINKDTESEPFRG